MHDLALASCSRCTVCDAVLTVASTATRDSTSVLMVVALEGRASRAAWRRVGCRRNRGLAATGDLATLRQP